jgi:hypothetical protein
MPSFRRIAPPIRWAQRTSPHGGQAAQPGTPKFLGLALERRVADRLPEAIHGQWFKFKDTNGVGYCQPDFILFRGAEDGTREILVLECKHTYHTYAFGQLHHLYVPIISFIYQLPARGLLLTSKNWEKQLADIL